MSNDHKGKVIKYNFNKDSNETSTHEFNEINIVVDLRKNQLEKMIDDLASLNNKHEDLLEG